MNQRIKEALETAMARIGCPPGDNADADIYRDLQHALALLAEVESKGAPIKAIKELADQGSNDRNETTMNEARPPMTHELKCHPEPFQAVKDRAKPFEWRKDDRDYQVGDTLWLREWDPDKRWKQGRLSGGIIGYTGRECHRLVTYIIRKGFGIPEGYCIMGIAEQGSEGEAVDGKVIKGWVTNAFGGTLHYLHSVRDEGRDDQQPATLIIHPSPTAAEATFTTAEAMADLEACQQKVKDSGTDLGELDQIIEASRKTAHSHGAALEEVIKCGDAVTESWAEELRDEGYDTSDCFGTSIDQWTAATAKHRTAS